MKKKISNIIVFSIFIILYIGCGGVENGGSDPFPDLFYSDTSYNESINFQVDSISNGEGSTIIVRKTIDEQLSLVGTVSDYLRSHINIKRYSNGEETDVKDVNLVGVSYDAIGDITEIILDIESITMVRNDRIEIIMNAEIFTDQNGKLNKELTIETIVQ